MRLVHQAEEEFAVAPVLGGKLRPEIHVLRNGRATLADDLSIPASIIVNINDARCTGSQASLDQLIILPGVCRIQLPSKLVVEQVLPADRQSEEVEIVILDEMLHL